MGAALEGGMERRLYLTGTRLDSIASSNLQEIVCFPWVRTQGVLITKADVPVFLKLLLSSALGGQNGIKQDLGVLHGYRTGQMDIIA